MTDVERNILGAIIEQPRAFDFFHGHLRVEDFEDPECARVWQHILSLHAGSLPISPRTVAEKAGADIATVLLRHELEYPSTPKQWRNWLQQHTDDVARRQIATTARRLLDGAHTEPLQDLRAELDRLARGVNDRRARRAAPVRDVAERAINRMAAGDAESGLMTGYSRMDEFLNGLRGFIVVGADASMGKTAGLCNLFARLYTRGAKPGYLSCEDEDEPLVRRMMQAHGKFNWRAAASGNYGVTEENRIADRCREFKGHDGWILDGLSSAADICAEARRLVEREGCGCLMIDYLQLAEAEGNPRTEYEGITSVSKTFVRLQKELRVPVIVAAQLNRRREESGQLPGLHHLKGSGQIGQDADLVLLLYRETRAAEDMLMIVAKHRNGPTGTLHFRFDGHTQVIEEADPPSDEDGEPTRYPTTPRIDGPPSLTG